MPRERPERPTGGGGGGTGGTGTSVYISGNPAIADASEYNIQINFVGSLSADLRQAFVSAAEAISDFILGDVATLPRAESPSTICYHRVAGDYRWLRGDPRPSRT